MWPDVHIGETLFMVNPSLELTAVYTSVQEIEFPGKQPLHS